MPDFVKYPDPQIRSKAKPVETIDDSIQRLIDRMIDDMYDGNGVGLAAPQIGVPLRVIVFDPGKREGGGKPQVLINPELVSGEGEVCETEGCLSVPGRACDVPRYEKVTVRGLDRKGHRVKIKEATGLLARVLQHEIDHLDGMLIIDRGEEVEPDADEEAEA